MDAETINPDRDTFGDILDRHAATHPDRIAVVGEGRALSYRDLAREVDACARAMLAAGLRGGDRIAVLSTPRPEAMITFLAAARLGIMWLGLNPKYRRPELEYILTDSQPHAFFGIAAFEGRDYSADVAALRAATPSLRFAVGFEPASCYDAEFPAWVAAMAPAARDSDLEAATASVSTRAPALLVYTSGSSGRPKGVILRQRELLRRSLTQNAEFPVDPFPRLINPLPINHIGGMHFLSSFTFVGGGTLIYEPRFSPERFLQAIRDGEVNTLIVLPTMLQLMVREPDFSVRLLDKLKWVIFSGAAMSRETVDILFDAACRVGLTYGMTETCGSVTYARKDGANQEVLTRTIGRPTPDGEARLIRDDGAPCGVGETGEIQVRAEYCMAEYFNRPEATAAVFTLDGWLRTGDTATLRADGNIEFVGRLSEMFKSGGYNVYPREVELAMEAHPEVELSAVVGVPDPLFGEVGWAYVIPTKGSTLDAETLRAFCAERLANYKIPKRFHLREELPTLPIGKVDKQTLKKGAALEAVQPAEND